MITVNDARRLGFCSVGIRRFARRYGIDMKKLLKEGISEEELLATKDSLALNLVTAVKTEQNRG